MCLVSLSWLCFPPFTFLHPHKLNTHTHRNLNIIRAENTQLSSENEEMRRKLSMPQPTKYTAEKKVLEAENAKLRQALLTALQGLSEEEREEEEGGHHHRH